MRRPYTHSSYGSATGFPASKLNWDVYVVLIMDDESNGSSPASWQQADSPQNPEPVIERGVVKDADIERTKRRNLRSLLNSLQAQASREQRKYGKTFTSTSQALRDARREWRRSFQRNRRGD